MPAVSGGTDEVSRREAVVARPILSSESLQLPEEIGSGCPLFCIALDL
ncbi:MAG: hypothetical protein KF708_08075 [Pirellulales bacterium]|nr:hypothetical protein [Pirellulales bacterium]